METIENPFENPFAKLSGPRSPKTNLFGRTGLHATLDERESLNN